MSALETNCSMNKPYVDTLNENIFARNLTPSCDLKQQQRTAMSSGVTAAIRSVCFDRPGAPSSKAQQVAQAQPAQSMADLFKTMHEPDVSSNTIVEACLTQQKRQKCAQEKRGLQPRPNYNQKDKIAMRKILTNRKRRAR